MFRNLVFLSGLIVIGATTAPALAQCANHITMLPIPAMKAASRPRDFVRFKYSLSSSDSLLIRSHEDPGTTIGPYDLGFVIARDGKWMQSVTLRALPEFRHEDSEFSESFRTVAVTHACASEGPIYFVTMQYTGDVTSPALVVVVVPSAQGYEVSTLPMFSGGIVDVFAADPLHVRVWDNLHEGMCEACETAYRITEYEIRDGKPVRTRQHRTRHLYSSGQFDDSRVRFVP
ncbi:hypothetical protein [Edaphobacter bradus]|uniref:hypothetical protein n=1 Tax=Edaphobacter bradus TaxID=2259016 RepID=UPI0021E02F1E|nr:hypothetical protein [Edaphobacter bradus]